MKSLPSVGLRRRTPVRHHLRFADRDLRFLAAPLVHESRNRHVGAKQRSGLREHGGKFGREVFAPIDRQVRPPKQHLLFFHPPGGVERVQRNVEPVLVGGVGDSLRLGFADSTSFEGPRYFVATNKINGEKSVQRERSSPACIGSASHLESRDANGSPVIVRPSRLFRRNGSGRQKLAAVSRRTRQRTR